MKAEAYTYLHEYAWAVGNYSTRSVSHAYRLLSIAMRRRLLDLSFLSRLLSGHAQARSSADTYIYAVRKSLAEILVFQSRCGAGSMSFG